MIYIINQASAYVLLYNFKKFIPIQRKHDTLRNLYICSGVP